MAKRKKQKWGIGDVFLVPLSDKTYTVGQVIGIEKEALNSAICGFSLVKVEDKQTAFTFSSDDFISVLFVTTDLLDSGDWPIVSNLEPVNVYNYFDIDRLRAEGFIGVKVTGSGIVIKFMDACFGYYPWNGFYQSNYLDQFLLSPDKKPLSIVLKES